MLYLQTGALNANTRLAIQSWKSQIANTENPGYAKNQAQPQDQKQTKLRETRDSSEKAWAKLDIGA
jgi:hypothetical protein